MITSKIGKLITSCFFSTQSITPYSPTFVSKNSTEYIRSIVSFHLLLYFLIISFTTLKNELASPASPNGKLMQYSSERAFLSPRMSTENSQPISPSFPAPLSFPPFLPSSSEFSKALFATLTSAYIRMSTGEIVIGVWTEGPGLRSGSLTGRRSSCGFS